MSEGDISDIEEGMEGPQNYNVNAHYSKSLASLPRYNGTGSWVHHENALVNWIILNHLEAAPADWLKTSILYSLTGQAAERGTAVGRGTQAFTHARNKDDFLEVLRNIFSPRADSEIARIAFRSRRQAAKEDVVSYITSKISLFTQAYDDDHQNYDVLLDSTIEGFCNNVIKRQVRRMNPRDRNSLIEAATNVVAAERYAFHGGYSESTTLDGLSTIIETSSGNFFRNQEEPMEIDEIGGQRKETRKCYHCGKIGHLIKDCRKKKKERKPQDKKKKDGCFNCGGRGHYAKDCKKPKQNKKENVQQVEEEEDQPEVYEEEA